MRRLVGGTVTRMHFLLFVVKVTLTRVHYAHGRWTSWLGTGITKSFFSPRLACTIFIVCRQEENLYKSTVILGLH
ncbi:hypothetical protein M758_UG006300 [Ceratodon purpureus]|nr:hypothetical protein M758_UG006300 [Ceratodon purpureus]